MPQSSNLTDQIWRRNLHVLSIAVFFAGIAFSEIMPFISLFLAELGNFTHKQLTNWSGIVFSVSYVVATIVTPWWGKLADAKGRKPMILRASLGMGIVIGAIGLVTNVWQLVVLRMLQGAFAGFVSNSNALIATEVPKEHSGSALGTMMACFTGGNLLGPFIGGTIATFFGYRFTFFLTGFILIVICLACWKFVDESNFHPVATKEVGSSKDVIKSLVSARMIFGLVLTTVIIQSANNSINPIISLFVKQLLHGSSHTTFVSGVIAALPGIATITIASRVGNLGDRIGTDKILIFGFILNTIVFIPTAFVSNCWQLGICRFIVGLVDACLFPQVQTMLTKNSPVSATGRVFSWNQSAMYIGNIVGSLMGGWVAGQFGFSAVFLWTAGLVFLNLILFLINVEWPLHHVAGTRS
ncbi:MFS transporter [Limosilactobacillus sp.]|uniref:MFS transporter n=1 Tax=Limosilactobacillus sp. TaxID=2773925 RepID=UPI00345E9CD2